MLLEVRVIPHSEVANDRKGAKERGMKGEIEREIGSKREGLREIWGKRLKGKMEKRKEGARERISAYQAEGKSNASGRFHLCSGTPVQLNWDNSHL